MLLCFATLINKHSIHKYLVYILILVPEFCYGNDNMVYGFRNIYFGTNISDARKIYKDINNEPVRATEDGKLKIFTRRNEDFIFENIKYDEISYVFVNNKFSAAELYIKSLEGKSVKPMKVRDELYRHMVGKYGVPSEIKIEKHWREPNLLANISFNHDNYLPDHIDLTLINPGRFASEGGFRELKWNTSIEEAKQIYKDFDCGWISEMPNMCKRTQEDINISNLPFDYIYYVFDSGRFYSIIASSKSLSGDIKLYEHKFDVLSKSIADKYSKYYKLEEIYYWFTLSDGNHSSITINYSSEFDKKFNEYVNIVEYDIRGGKNINSNNNDLGF